MITLIKSLCKNLLAIATICIAGIVMQSCVHEFPEINNSLNVRLKISHYTDWTEFDYFIDNLPDTRKTRTGDNNTWRAQYVVAVYAKGTTSTPVQRYSFTREDLTLSDFETELSLPVGEWDIYVWQDFVNQNVDPAYYNSSDFKAITYEKPYRGDTNMRDAFEGKTSVKVPETIEADYVVTGEIEMERPLAKYVFIATDFEEFYNDSMTRFQLPVEKNASSDPNSVAQQRESLTGFSVVAKYPWYMPAVYDMFSQKVTDSWTGMYYDALINPISNTEAVIASDYVFINHHESGAQVQLGMRTPDDAIIGLTSTINVPLLRGRITYVRGRFLTASTGSGLEIDFSFSGSFDILIK